VPFSAKNGLDEKIKERMHAMTDFDCKENDCSGKVGSKGECDVMTGCRNYSLAYACNECGRLYWPDGNPVFNRSSEPAFFIDGYLGIKTRDGKMIFF
jgi:hypothetical protein